MVAGEVLAWSQVILRGAAAQGAAVYCPLRLAASISAPRARTVTGPVTPKSIRKVSRTHRDRTMRTAIT